MTKVNLTQKIQKFIDNLAQKGGKPLYELTPQEAREVLLNVQNINIDIPEVDISQITIAPKEGKTLPLEIIRPKDNKDPLPVIYYIHGGGWVMGDNITHRRLVAELVTGIPVTIIFPIYTQAPEGKFPDVIEDLFAGLQYVVQHGEELNINASRLAIVGDSVGGNMTMAMSLLAKQNKFIPQIKYQALLYPVTSAEFKTASYHDFANGPWLTKKAMEWFWDQYLPDKKARKNILASTLNASLEELQNLPPTLIITDENDVLRDEGEELAKKLDAAGVDVVSVRFNGTIHDFMVLNALSDTPQTRAAITLLKAKLKWALYQKKN